MPKSTPKFLFVVLYDELDETTSYVIGLYATHADAVKAIKMVSSKVVCTMETEYHGCPESEYCFEHGTSSFTIQQKIIG